mgnify:CR=1 FL=1
MKGPQTNAWMISLAVGEQPASVRSASSPASWPIAAIVSATSLPVSSISSSRRSRPRHGRAGRGRLQPRGDGGHGSLQPRSRPGAASGPRAWCSSHVPDELSSARVVHLSLDGIDNTDHFCTTTRLRPGAPTAAGTAHLAGFLEQAWCANSSRRRAADAQSNARSRRRPRPGTCPAHPFRTARASRRRTPRRSRARRARRNGSSRQLSSGLLVLVRGERDEVVGAPAHRLLSSAISCRTRLSCPRAARPARGPAKRR